MPQDYGVPAQEPHREARHQPPARYVVMIDAAGGRVARLYLADRTQVAEFQAGAEEVAPMIHGVPARRTADDPVWNEALRGHSDAERSAAEVYELAL